MGVSVKIYVDCKKVSTRAKTELYKKWHVMAILHPVVAVGASGREQKEPEFGGTLRALTDRRLLSMLCLYNRPLFDPVGV